MAKPPNYAAKRSPIVPPNRGERTLSFPKHPFRPYGPRPNPPNYAAAITHRASKPQGKDVVLSQTLARIGPVPAVRTTATRPQLRSKRSPIVPPNRSERTLSFPKRWPGKDPFRPYGQRPNPQSLSNDRPSCLQTAGKGPVPAVRTTAQPERWRQAVPCSAVQCRAVPRRAVQKTPNRRNKTKHTDHPTNEK